MKDQSEIEFNPDRVGALLRLAASEPVETDAPQGLATLGMAQYRARRRKRATLARGAALAVSGALVAVWAGFASLKQGAGTQNVHVKDVRLADAASPAPTISDHPTAKAGPKKTAQKPSNAGTTAKRAAQPAHRTARRPRREETRVHRRRPPSAYWQVATVHRYETELVTPALVAADDRENGAVIVQPAMLRIPVETGEAVPEGQNTWRLTPVARIPIKENHE